MARALEDTHLAGLGHNVPFLAAVMDQERFQSGVLTTNYIKDEFPEGFNGVEPSDLQVKQMIASAVAMNEVIAEQDGDPSERAEWTVLVDKAAYEVEVGYDEAEDLTVIIDDEETTLSEIDWRPGQSLFRAVLDEEAYTIEVKSAADGFDIRSRATKARVRIVRPEVAALYALLPEKQAADTSKLTLSPMPGLVVDIPVVEGQEVKTGETVAIIEAMKMQNILKAERDGKVKSVKAKAGDPVAADDVLVEFE